MTLPFGIDISKHQASADGKKVMNFEAVRNHNEKVSFIASRAGISWGYQDPQFSHHWTQSGQLKVGRIAYHVIYFGESAIAQMDSLFKMLDKRSDFVRDRIALDLEVQGINTRSRITATTINCLEICKTRTGRYPIVYSRASWVNSYLNVGDMPKVDWWLATYRKANPSPFYTNEHPGPPYLPNGVKNYLIHQTAEKGKSIGAQSHYMDYNRFNGTREQLDAYFGHTEDEPEPEPEPPVEKLFDAKVTTTPPNRLKTRYTPNGAERPKADWLQSQAIVPVYETHSTGWWRVAPEAWSSATWMERVEDKLPEPQEPLFQARVYSWATPYVNVRAEPSLSAGKVGFKYPLAVTDVMSTVPDWYEVPEGWMMSQFLERLDYEPPASLLAIKPLSQRDARWASHKLGYSYLTIGSHGCLITAICMILNWYGKQTDPAQLNDALVRVGGFTGANLYWNAIAQVQPDIYLAKSIDCYYIPAPLNEIDALLADDVPVLVHVDFTPGGAVDQHWVLIVGKSGDDYIINDPWTGEQGSFRTRYGDPARWIFRIRAYRRQA